MEVKSFSEEFKACHRAKLIPKFDVWFGGFMITAEQVEKELLKLENSISELKNAIGWAANQAHADDMRVVIKKAYYELCLGEKEFRETGI